MTCSGEGQSEAEGGAATLTLGFDPDLAFVRFDDSLDQSESDAGALDARIEAFEELENPVAVVRIDANAIVADEKDRSIALRALHPHLDARRGLITEEFCRILKQVLEDLPDPQSIDANLRGGRHQ